MTAETQWVDDLAALDRVAAALATSSQIALDTESNSMFAYRERLCLVQLGIADGDAVRVFLIDPLAFESPRAALAPLIPWMADSSHRVLLHGGEYDVAILKRDIGVAPTNVFDTQAAAAMLGVEKTGFGSLVEAFFDVALPKSHQQHNWARRPIPQAALGYAVADVRWLVPLAQVVEGLVAEADLEEEVALACAAVADARPHAPRDVAQIFWRTLSGHKLPRETLARLAALVAWREREAEARDQPPALMVPNDSLVRLAERAPTSPDELQGYGLARDIMARRGADIVAAIATADASLIPERPPRQHADPRYKARESKLKQWREREATARGVPLQVVLPARAIEHLALHGAAGLDAAPQLGPKRLGRYGATLTALLT